MSNYLQDDYGTVEMKHGYLFRWRRERNGEIYGYVEDPNGGIVKGSSGWYRTKDAKLAAEVAEPGLDEED